jgi:hypothetical protein
MRRNWLQLNLLFFFAVSLVEAQPGSLHLDMLLDMPSARVLSAGGIDTELRMYHNGGMLVTISVGISDRFSLGVAYGGENIIGTGKANLNPQPCVHAKYVLFEERFLTPALVLGFSSQGYGRYISDWNRYAIKSRGLYAAVSKNTSFLGGLGIHVGVNWSLENEDGDSDPNLFAGFHKRINTELVVLGEYDTAINDNNDNAIGAGKGYLNLGVRWSFAERFFVELAWKNVLENEKPVPGSSREVKLVYRTHF